jgi:hypothetical protein
MKVMGDVSRRLGPLAQFAESAGGMFGFRLPGSSRSTPPPAPEPTRLPAAPLARTPRSTTRTSATKKATTKKATKRSPAKKSAARKR